MPLVVQLNTRITSPVGGCIQSNNASYFDPVTHLNLTRSNNTSGDLSAFAPASLTNISNAVKFGTLSLISGTLPAPTASYAMYSNYVLNATAGVGVMASGGSGLDYHYGITGVAAADINEKNF